MSLVTKGTRLYITPRTLYPVILEDSKHGGENCQEFFAKSAT